MIIKCPECGHQVSDKAPVCPSCGVEIAGHIIKCSHCGELYLKEESSCPNCHHTEHHVESSVTATEHHTSEAANESKVQEPVVLMSVDKEEATGNDDVIIPVEETEEHETDNYNDKTQDTFNEPKTEEEAVDADFIMDDNADEEVIANAEAIAEDEEESTPDKNNHLSLAVSLLIAAITAAVLLFLYNQGVGASKANNEQEAFAQAMSSSEPTVLKNYLKENPSASKAHRDSISARLKVLTTTTQNMQQSDNDLSVALTSNSKEVLQQFIAKYPDSKHRGELEAKIDEIDWAGAVAKNNENAYLGYKAQHPNGIHSKEADEKLKNILTPEKAEESAVAKVTDGERAKAVAAVRQLLQGINSKSTDKISGAVAPSLNFLGSGGATVKDIRRYMTDRLYQADVKTINWHLGSPTEVTKKSNEAGADIRLKIPATLDIDRKGGKSKRSYVISATIKNGRITHINW
ncbi:MAG: zinc ribbon domain-containing protein [Prevotella sp.]|nr:zinc ribbon domain-containing protein [Prevotella sp.]